MSAYAQDKRTGLRRKQELVVGLRANAEINIAYTIDVSRGGVRVGSPLRSLSVGVPVELVIDNRGEKYPFAGRVARDDGAYFISRIGRTVPSFYIRIDDALFPNFVNDNYFI